MRQTGVKSTRRSWIHKKLLHFFWRTIGFLPDAPYVSLKYFSLSGRLPNLTSPMLFTEKLQVLKLADRNPLYPVMVDKDRAKDLIAERVGPEHVIETYWVGRDLDRVDWNEIPLPAVVKPTHSSGYGLFLRTPRDIDDLVRNNPGPYWLAQRHDAINREWAYADVVPQIIIERMLTDNGAIPDDYAFLVFSGEVALIRLRLRRDGDAFECIFTPDWQRIPEGGGCYPGYPGNIPRPGQLDAMIEIARRVSGGVPFVRADLYLAEGSVYVGELTLYPGGGFPGFVSDPLDRYLGQFWDAQLKARVPAPPAQSAVALGME